MCPLERRVIPEMVSPGQADRLRWLLREWGNDNIRQYPWRYVADPYCVLVSEFMLHRTQTVQVVPVYERFIREYPDLAILQEADRKHVSTLLQPLGLKWRIAGMLDALSEIWRLYGSVPYDYEKLISVRGIGSYIAGATVCFTQNQPMTLIDANTVRVVGRMYGLDLHGEARRRRPVIEAIAEASHTESPRDFYYSVIDLAHGTCHPRKPECRSCPLLSVPCAHGQAVVGTDDSGDAS